METRQDDRIAKRKLNSMKTSRTGTHSAMSEVMTTHSKTEVDPVSFFGFLGELFQTTARKSHNMLTERRHVCNKLVDRA